jgi:hypothetical protein
VPATRKPDHDAPAPTSSTGSIDPQPPIDDPPGQQGEFLTTAPDRQTRKHR